MRLDNLIEDLIIEDLLESALPDFILAFTFFMSLSYAVLGKRFGQQRPAIAMSATIGFALAAGLIWWERATGFSIKDLGPIAIGFAIIALAFVMYQSIRQIGGSWAGAAIAFGVSILIAKLLQLNVPIDPEIIQVVTMVALVAGILALVSHTRGHAGHPQRAPVRMPEVRHDMSDLYGGRQLSDRLTRGLRRLRRETKTLNEHPQETAGISLQLQRMLPAEGWLTERMAQLRAKAHKIRNGHIARLEETRSVFSKLPTSAKKKAAADLVGRYRQIAGIDTRLERLDKAVAENERRIIELTRRARQYTTKYDSRKLADCMRTAEKLQHHNSTLIKLISRTEEKLSAIAKKVANEVRQVEK